MRVRVRVRAIYLRVICDSMIVNNALQDRKRKEKAWGKLSVAGSESGGRGRWQEQGAGCDFGGHSGGHRGAEGQTGNPSKGGRREADLAKVINTDQRDGICARPSRMNGQTEGPVLEFTTKLCFEYKKVQYAMN